MAHGDHLDLGPHAQFGGDHVSVNSNWPVPLAIRNVPSFQTLGLTTNFHHLFGIAYLLSNSMMYGEEENHCFENLLAQFPTSLLITLLASNSPTLWVFFEKILTYLFEADRRDDFEALIEAMVHHHPDWLASAIGKYLFYAATMHCLHACELLLEVESIRFVGHLSEELSFDTLQGILKGEHRHYDLAIFSAISAGYLDCARLLIRHVAENYPLPQDHNHDTTLPPYNGLASHNLEYPENQLTCTFLHAIFVIRCGGFYYRSHGTRRGARMIPLRYEMETVQHAFDIFIEFGLNVDALMPSWLQDDSIPQAKGYRSLRQKHYEAMEISTLHVDLQTPIHLLPTILDVVWNLNEEIFHYLVGDSKRVATGLTRSGLYLAAERGSGYLRQYLDVAWSQPLECREFFELVLAEQFTLRFDLDIVQTLLSRGIGFGAFPQDFNMSLLLERLVTEVKQHGIKTYALDILNQLLGEGVTIDADVINVAVESQGTNLLTLLSGYGSTDIAIHGTSAIFIAAFLDNYQAVDYLLEAGVDINAGICLGCEPITIVGAFFKIGRGASLCPHPGNSQPNSLLLHAIIFGKGRPNILEIFTYLLVVQGGFHNPSDSQPCLLEACFQGHQNCPHSTSKDLDCSLRFFNLVINSSIPIKGSGVLGLLIEQGAAIDLIQMVMDEGVNVNTYSGRGIEHRVWSCRQITPLQAAAGLSKLSLVKTLVNDGAEINLPAKGVSGSTALQAACQFYPTTDGERSTKTRLVNYLINKGADVNAAAAPVRGFTALQAAAQLGDIQTAIVLLDHGADVNAQPSQKHGWCALDAAAFSGRLDMTKFLLDLGALSWDRGGSGYAGAIKLAEDGGYWAVLDLIQERATLCTQIRSALEEGDI
ncbi:hypothetical protein E0Z10_g1838 [Xylaria hypoxylon]|uniref:Uncharacterized protein n=1 Tax=Xylaria hypoxylon TaxID=37992 RepID=A0A4Z0Z7T7_9PEZI|nr:hypothetical protein E0Z10_g1838 [Xylaria hypoxylon]